MISDESRARVRAKAVRRAPETVVVMAERVAENLNNNARWKPVAYALHILRTSSASQKTKNPQCLLGFHAKWRRGGDSNPTILPVNKGESHADSRIDSRNPIPSCPELSQVVTAWAKLPAAIKTAILALVNTAG